MKQTSMQQPQRQQPQQSTSTSRAAAVAATHGAARHHNGNNNNDNDLTPRARRPDATTTSHVCSPFSPLLWRSPYKRRRSSSTLNNNNNMLSLLPCRKVSVVVLVSHPYATMDPHSNNNNSNNDTKARQPQPQLVEEASRLCLFPLPIDPDDDTTTTAATTTNYKNNNSSRDLIVVNPTVFGNLIPVTVTMETAKMVAQIAHISSEDWTRTYRFQHVVWPYTTGRTTSTTVAANTTTANTTTTSTSSATTTTHPTPATTSYSSTNTDHNNNTDKDNDKTLIHLCRAAVNDVMAPGSTSSRDLIALGDAATKSQTLFGATALQSVARVFAQTTNDLTDADILERYGLLGWTVQAILQQIQQQQEQQQQSNATDADTDTTAVGTVAVTLSVLEVADDDSLYDLLAIRPFTSDAAKKVTLQHASAKRKRRNSSTSKMTIPSKRTSSSTTNGTTKCTTTPGGSRSSSAGAVLHNLTNLPIDSLKSTGHGMRRALAAAHHKDRTTTVGTVIATIKIWQPAAASTATSSSSSSLHKYDGTSIQFIDVGSTVNIHSQLFQSGTHYNYNNNNIVRWQRHNAALRKTLWALGGTLRGTLLKEAAAGSANTTTNKDAATVVSYRDSMLTRVLQRSMDHPDARTVVLACVSPLSAHYDETLATLRYVHRLIHRPGGGAAVQSPYEIITTSSAASGGTSGGGAKTTTTSPSTSSTSPMSQFSLGPYHYPFHTTTAAADTNTDTTATATSPPDDSSSAFLLQQLVSDPRQRLAKVFPPSDNKRKAARTSSRSRTPDDPNYVPTTYMNIDPASITWSARRRASPALPPEEEKEEGIYFPDAWPTTERRTAALVVEQKEEEEPSGTDGATVAAMGSNEAVDVTRNESPVVPRSHDPQQTQFVVPHGTSLTRTNFVEPAAQQLKSERLDPGGFRPKEQEEAFYNNRDLTTPIISTAERSASSSTRTPPPQQVLATTVQGDATRNAERSKRLARTSQEDDDYQMNQDYPQQEYPPRTGDAYECPELEEEAYERRPMDQTNIPGRRRENQSYTTNDAATTERQSQALPRTTEYDESPPEERSDYYLYNDPEAQRRRSNDDEYKMNKVSRNPSRPAETATRPHANERLLDGTRRAPERQGQAYYNYHYDDEANGVVSRNNIPSGMMDYEEESRGNVDDRLFPNPARPRRQGHTTNGPMTAGGVPPQQQQQVPRTENDGSHEQVSYEEGSSGTAATAPEPTRVQERQNSNGDYYYFLNDQTTGVSQQLLKTDEYDYYQMVNERSSSMSISHEQRNSNSEYSNDPTSRAQPDRPNTQNNNDRTKEVSHKLPRAHEYDYQERRQSDDDYTGGAQGRQKKENLDQTTTGVSLVPPRTADYNLPTEKRSGPTSGLEQERSNDYYYYDQTGGYQEGLSDVYNDDQAATRVSQNLPRAAEYSPQTDRRSNAYLDRTERQSDDVKTTEVSRNLPRTADYGCAAEVRSGSTIAQERQTSDDDDKKTGTFHQFSQTGEFAPTAKVVERSSSTSAQERHEQEYYAPSGASSSRSRSQTAGRSSTSPFHYGQSDEYDGDTRMSPSVLPTPVAHNFTSHYTRGTRDDIFPGWSGDSADDELSLELRLQALDVHSPSQGEMDDLSLELFHKTFPHNSPTTSRLPVIDGALNSRLAGSVQLQVEVATSIESADSAAVQDTHPMISTAPTHVHDEENLSLSVDAGHASFQSARLAVEKAAATNVDEAGAQRGALGRTPVARQANIINRTGLMEDDLRAGNDAAAERGVSIVDSFGTQSSLLRKMEEVKRNSPTQGISQDIGILQAVVDQIKSSADRFVCDYSTSAIDNLRRFQESQSAIVANLVEQHEQAARETENLKSQLEDQVQLHSLDLRQMEDTVAALRSEIVETRNGRSEAVKIAEQAISLQEELEQKVTELEQELVAQSEQTVPIEELHVLQEKEGNLLDEIRDLEHEISVYKSEISSNDQELDDLRRQLEEAKAKNLRQGADNVRYKNEIDQLLEKQKQLQRSEAEFVAFEREVERLKTEMAAAKSNRERREAELQREVSEKEAEISRLKQETESSLYAAAKTKDAVLEELDRTRKELEKRLSDVGELSSSLKKLLREKEDAEDRSGRMEASLQSFQSDTRAKLQKLLHDRREAKGLLSSTLEENAALAQTIQELQASLEALRRERDDVFDRHEENNALAASLEEENRHLKDANRKMKISLEAFRRETRVENSTFGQLELENADLKEANLMLREELRKVRQGATAPDTRGYDEMEAENADLREANRRLKQAFYEFRLGAVAQDKMDFDQMGYRADRDDPLNAGLRIPRDEVLRNQTDSYVQSPGRSSDFAGGLAEYGPSSHTSKSDVDLRVRAEEVAAYMAVSAKASIERKNSESFRLKQQIYALEDSKDAEIDALRLRVRTLERLYDADRHG